MNDQTRVLGVAPQQPAEAVALVPIHPRLGPLWANTVSTAAPENVPKSYPLMPLYAAAQPPSPPAPSADLGPCYCPPDACQAPVIMGRRTPCLRSAAPPQPPVPEPSAALTAEQRAEAAECAQALNSDLASGYAREELRLEYVARAVYLLIALAGQSSDAPVVPTQDVGIGLIGDCPYCLRTVHWAKSSASPTAEPSADAVREASNDGVICPGCAHQFRAIPVNVQALLLLAGFSPPFLESTAPHAVRDVLAERRRQTEAEGWTLGHDDGHDDGALSMAAAGYALEASEAILNCAHELTGPGEPSLDDVQGGTPSAAVWPAGWEFKPATPRRMLVKAGALILAEIERLDRAAIAASPKDQGSQP